MLSRDDLRRFIQLRSEDGIVSAYIGLNPHFMHDPAHPVTQFKSAVKRFVRRTREGRWLEVLEREREKVQAFLERLPLQGRGTVIFTSQPAGIWEVLRLGVPVPSLVHVNTTAYTRILATVLDEYPHMVVAVVQKDRARLYVSEQRAAEALGTITSEVPGWHDQGGWAQARFQRHIEFHVAEHLKKVVEELQRLYYTGNPPFRHLVIGGTEGAANDLLKMLPDPLARLVIGTFPVDVKHERESDILERAWEIWREHERRSERDLVNRVMETAQAAGPGVLGIDPSLHAIAEGRVHTLIVAHGLATEGFACTRCDHFSALEFTRCPVCGGAAEPTSDIVDRAVEKAYLAGAEVEVVLGEAANRLMRRGGMGAMLRY